MVFASPLFLFGFLPGFLLLYFLTPRRFVNVTALVASLLFYAWGEPVFVLYAIGSALFDLVLVKGIAATRRERLRRLLVAIGVLANVGLLAYIKYANFATVSVAWAVRTWFGIDLPVLDAVALPIGVSFIVFEKITYIVDVARGVGKPAQSVRDYLLYVFLFPKLLAGPIIKYHDIEAQLRSHDKRFDDVAHGITRFAFGLAKKVLLADPMGELADAVFAPTGGSIGFRLAWLGAFAFALQIYFDFSGYSDMAIGLARTMGFRLMENFDRPYLAVGFGDFWRRWHISLSTWIRDYLYIPLGGDRVPAPRLYLNLWICFLASGLWHGASWTFVGWGAYHGFFLTLDRLFMRRALLRVPRVCAVALTFVLVTIGWVLFRAPNFGVAFRYVSAMFEPSLESKRLVLVSADQAMTFVICLAICFLPLLGVWQRLTSLLRAPALATVSMIAACLLLVLSIAKTTAVAFHPFLYFRF